MAECMESLLKLRKRLFTAIDEALKDMPAVDVAPVRHGRWVEKEKYTFGIMYDCSLCENRILDTGHPWHYCPNCGAKMDESEDKNEIF